MFHGSKSNHVSHIHHMTCLITPEHWCFSHQLLNLLWIWERKLTKNNFFRPKFLGKKLSRRTLTRYGPDSKNTGFELVSMMIFFSRNLKSSSRGNNCWRRFLNFPPLLPTGKIKIKFKKSKSLYTIVSVPWYHEKIFCL